MKRLPVLLIPLLLILPAAAIEKTEQARLRLPWDALKGVLRLDQDQVRLNAAEFDVLLKMTSRQQAPAHIVKDGDVILTRAEFNQLIQALISPATPTANVFVPKGLYRGRLTKSGALVEATLYLEVPQKPAKPIEWDAFPASVAFQEILLNGKPALTAVRNGRLVVTLADPGSHRLDLRFSVPAPDSQASQTLGLALADTPITEWVFDIPEPNLDIAVPGALYRELTGIPGGTRVRALLPPSTWVAMTWNPLAPDRGKGPSQVYATVDHLISIEEDALRVKSRVDLEVLQNTINELVLGLPAGFAVLDVQGDAMKEWQEEGPRLSIPFKSARKGTLRFDVTLERVLPGAKSTTTFTGLEVLGAQRQRGFLGVDLKSDVELPLPLVQGLEPKDPFRELPPSLAGQSQRLVFGYQYLRPAFSIGFQLSRHESVNVPLSFVDRAEGSTVVRPDGKRVHQATYWVKSSAQQFLGVTLPEKAALWNAFVDNAPVKPVEGPGKKTLIPLVRSARSGDALVPVEIVVYEEKPRLRPFGSERVRIPMPDLMVNRIQWTVVAPPEHRYRYFGRDFEQQQPLAPQVGTQGGFASHFREHATNNMSLSAKAAKPNPARRDEIADMRVLAEEAAVDALDDGETVVVPTEMDAPPPPALGAGVGGKEVEILKRKNGPVPTGMLPVRVAVPDRGDRYVFSKTLPAADGVLTLPLWHWARWMETGGKVLIGLVFLSYLIIVRHRIFRASQKILPSLRAGLHQLGPLGTPLGGVFSTLALALALSVLPVLFALAVLAYAVAVSRWLLSLFNEGERR